MRPIPIHIYLTLRKLSYNLTYLTRSLIVNPYIHHIHTHTYITHIHTHRSRILPIHYLLVAYLVRNPNHTLEYPIIPRKHPHHPHHPKVIILTTEVLPPSFLGLTYLYLLINNPRISPILDTCSYCLIDRNLRDIERHRDKDYHYYYYHYH